MIAKSSQPLVSIIIPTYNRSHFLYHAVKSAIGQSYRNIEIIILDDCSPDDTPQIAAQFEENPRVKYVRHANNLGITGNWKWGISAARGEFFCLLHDDDTFEPDFIEKVVAPLIVDPDLILSFSDHWVMNRDGQRLLEVSKKMTIDAKRRFLNPGYLDDFAQSALIDLSLPVGASIFRRSLIDFDFIDDRAKGSIDAWLFYCCVRTGKKSFFVKEKLMNYREHDGGMTKSMGSYMNEGHIYRYKSMYEDESIIRLRPKVKMRLARSLSDEGRYFLVAGHSLEARKSLVKSLRMSLNIRSIVLFILSLIHPFGYKILNKFIEHKS